MVSIVPTKKGPSISHLFENLFIPLSDRDITHERFDFRTKDSIWVKLMGRGNDGGCLVEGAGREEAIGLEVKESICRRGFAGVELMSPEYSWDC